MAEEARGRRRDRSLGIDRWLQESREVGGGDYVENEELIWRCWCSWGCFVQTRR